MTRKIYFFFAMVTLLVSIDAITKYWVEKKLVIKAAEAQEGTEDYQYLVNYKYFSDDNDDYLLKEVTLINYHLSLVYTRNYNIGFSILSFLDNYFTTQQISLIIKLLQGCILIIILAYFFFNKMKYFWAFSFIISGGLGNNLDRLSRGYVVDFFKFSLPQIPVDILNPWPIFNFADVWVSIGGGILLLNFIFEKPTNEAAVEIKKETTSNKPVSK